MKILSFDVGVKNLAYCMLDANNDKKIIDWGILNISIEPTCEHILKDRKCDNTAKKIIDGTLLCTAHCKLKKYNGKKVKNIKKNDNKMLNQGINIVNMLDEKENFLEANVICIENQPALKNPTMKSIQMIIYSYFLIKGVVDITSVNNIEMINARNKLKAYQGEDIECDIKDKYKRTKYLGIKYCESMIKDEDEMYVDKFNYSRKKDDLADAYLQGMYYIQHVQKNNK